MLTESSLHVNVDTDCELLRAEDVRMLMQLTSALRSILVKLEPRTRFTLNDQPNTDNFSSTYMYNRSAGVYSITLRSTCTQVQ